MAADQIQDLNFKGLFQNCHYNNAICSVEFYRF